LFGSHCFLTGWKGLEAITRSFCGRFIFRWDRDQQKRDGAEVECYVIVLEGRSLWRRSLESGVEMISGLFYSVVCGGFGSMLLFMLGAIQRIVQYSLIGRVLAPD
jgi:hypothetical protein